MFENMADILKQISLGEDSVLELKTVEFSGEKITGPHRNSMADELAAMANTHTGVVLLGVDDKSKTILGIPKDYLDVVEAWLREIRNDLIEPPLDCVIRRTPMTTEDGGEKIIIRVDVPRSLKSVRASKSMRLFSPHWQLETADEAGSAGPAVSATQPSSPDTF
ncbi:MAG: ATP-binding protein [Candidatus Contendobacter sp.]